MFLSSYENKIDKKGRVSVPASFRSFLTTQGYNGFVSYPSFSNPALECCTQERIEKLSNSIDTLNPFEENRDIFSTSILANSFQLNFDNDGRITLIDKLLSHSGVKDKVLFVGQGRTFQMWEPAAFKKFSDDARKKASLKRSELKWKQTN